MEIFCEMSSVSSSNAIHWFHDNAILRDGHHGYVVTEITTKHSRRSKLIKSSVSLKDDGEYKCQASNMAGSAEETITVHVTGIYVSLITSLFLYIEMIT